MTREIIMNELRNRGYEVQSADVTKNRVKLQGISIGTGNIRPTIYVDKYLEENNLSKAVNDIIDIYENSVKNPFQFDPKEFMTWDNIKTRLQLCLQRKGSEDIVKRDFLDLEQYVRVIVSMDDNGTGSFKVTPSQLEVLGISEEQLFNAAWDCTKPTIIKEDMVQIIANMMGITVEEVIEDAQGMPTQIVITNQSKTNGAIAMCDIWLLSEIADRYKSDLAILPSSIHEVIVMPVDERTNFNDLNNMVADVNTTQVLPEEQLSNHAYRFDHITREIIF